MCIVFLGKTFIVRLSLSRLGVSAKHLWKPDKKLRKELGGNREEGVFPQGGTQVY